MILGFTLMIMANPKIIINQRLYVEENFLPI
jgi:hypothetical protein